MTASRYSGAANAKRRCFAMLAALGLTFLLSACISGMQKSPFTAALPKVETTPPANYTKGAPAYEMRFRTNASTMPGMPGTAGMMGMMGMMGGGDSRMMTLRMISHPGPSDGASPKAYHMIPPAMSMGDYLPLLPPVKESASPGTSTPGEHSAEKPERMVIKTYWGCGETVRQGQPRVIDTSNIKDSPDMVFSAQGKAAYAGRMGLDGLKPSWVEVLWPNRDDSRPVPGDASLVGEHFVHGNFLPHIRFHMDTQHDIMGKMSVSAQSQSLKGAIPLTWNKVPTAIGYHLTAMAFNHSRKEIIIWTSSENPNVNVSGQFLDTPQVRKHIAAKVIMPADRDRCVIPNGIFAEADAVIVTATAWGDDYWASQPPRPANPPKNWKPDWVVKGQFLSTGTLMLGMPTGGSGNGSSGSSGSDLPLPARLGDTLRGWF